MSVDTAKGIYDYGAFCTAGQTLEFSAASYNTVTVRHCQWFVQPTSPAVSHGSKLYDMNSPSASLAAIIRIRVYMCTVHV